MKKNKAAICLAAVMIGLFLFALAEQSGPYSSITAFNPGKYFVGKNLDAGEYILFSLPYASGSFAICADENGTEVISEGTFDANSILTVEEGDCLVIADCVAVLSGDYYRMNRIVPSQSGGMFKVGVDVPSGTFKLTGQNGATSVYRIYNDVRLRNAVDEREFHYACNVRLKNNQYLELINCTISGLNVKSTATSQPRRTPTPAPAETPDPDANPAQTSRPATVLDTVTPIPLTTPTPKPTEAAQAQTESQQPAQQEQPVQTEQSTAAPEPTPIPKPTQKVHIHQDRSPVLRSLPSTKGEIIGEAKPGAVYELLDIDDKWFKIRLENGLEGWITNGMADLEE